MADIDDDGMAPDDGDAGPSGGQSLPQIDGGLLDPLTFPAYLLGGGQTVAGPPAPAAGASPDTDDSDVHAEVERDIQTAQAALRPADYAQIAAQASQIAGPLMTDPPGLGSAGSSAVPASPGGPLDPGAFPLYGADLGDHLPALSGGGINAGAANTGGWNMGNAYRGIDSHGLRHIDPYPGMNYVSPGQAPLLTMGGLKNFIEGITIPDPGPHITFVNDQPRNPSPDQPVTDATASMVEHGVVDSGFNSVNVNSTTGGKHGKDSNHPLPKARAVNIDMIDGRVISPGNPDTRTLQDVFARQPDIHENFGPGYQATVPRRGARPMPVPNVKEDHQGHDHFSALPRGNR